MHSPILLMALTTALFITTTLTERQGGFPPDLNFKLERRQFRPEDGIAFPPGFPFAANIVSAHAPGFPFQSLDGDSHAALSVIQKHELREFCEKLNTPSHTKRDSDGTEDGGGEKVNVNQNMNINELGVMETSVSYSYSYSEGNDRKDGDGDANVNVNSNANVNRGEKSLDEPDSDTGRDAKTLEKRQSSSYSSFYSSGGGGNVNISYNNNNGHTSYNINGVEVPEELTKFQPAALSAACSTYLSGSLEEPALAGKFRNVYYGYATATPVQYRLTPWLEPEQYAMTDFDEHRMRCGNAAEAKSDIGAFIVETDFETNKCYLVTGGGIDAKRDLKDDKEMKKYLEAWNKVK